MSKPVVVDCKPRQVRLEKGEEYYFYVGSASTNPRSDAPAGIWAFIEAVS